MADAKRRMLVFFSIALLALMGSTAVLAQEGGSGVPSGHTFEQTAGTRLKAQSYMRTLRSKSLYYLKRAQEEIVRTAKQKPVVALLSIMLIVVPPVFGFNMAPALLMAVAYFTVNVFVDLGAVGYIVALGCGFFVVVNNIFE